MFQRGRVVAGGGEAVTHAAVDWTISPAFLRGDNRGWRSCEFPMSSQAGPTEGFLICLHRALGLGAELGATGNTLTSVLRGKPPRAHDAEGSGGDR